MLGLKLCIFQHVEFIYNADLTKKTRRASGKKQNSKFSIFIMLGIKEYNFQPSNFKFDALNPTTDFEK